MGYVAGRDRHQFGAAILAGGGPHDQAPVPVQADRRPHQGGREAR
jgi:hypothetical protein